MPDGSLFPPAAAPWPLTMDEPTSARFTGYSRRDFRALVACGVLPPPRVLPPVSQPRWHRLELELVVNRIWNLDRLDPAKEDEAGRQAAMDALKNYDPTASRRRPRTQALREGGPEA